jgi:hypothetical protein
LFVCWFQKNFFANNQINTSEKKIKSMNILCNSFGSFLCFMERVVAEGVPTIMDSMCWLLLLCLCLSTGESWQNQGHCRTGGCENQS